MDELLASEHGQFAQRWPPVLITPFKSEMWTPQPFTPLRKSTDSLLAGVKYVLFGLFNPTTRFETHSSHRQRILEFSRFVFGPVCGYLATAMGANVVRVSSPALDEYVGFVHVRFRCTT